MKALLAISHLLLTGLCAAQQWCVPGATWYYSTDPSIPGYTKYVYTGDTLLDGTTGNVIRFSVNDGPYINPRYITRAGDDVVYIYQDFPEWEISFWDTLIWFGAVPGDHWNNLTYIDHSCECTYTVIDTGHVEVDGVRLRTVDVGDECCWSESKRFTERIGWDGDPYVCPSSIDATCLPALRCYSDNEISFETGLVPFCDWIVGVEENLAPQPWTILTEAHGRIRIAGLEPGHSLTVRFVDTSGRTVLMRPRSKSSPILDVSSLTDGVYIVQVLGMDETRSQRWVKY